MSTYWVQVDAVIGGLHRRFYMDGCGGRDQVAMAIQNGGWRSYEPPLPELVFHLSNHWHAAFIDVGANTGFYSLLAAAAGAEHAWAFEPVPEIFGILESNVLESAATGKVSRLPLALGESAGHVDFFLPDDSHGLIETSGSLNRDFRSVHSGVIKVEVATLDDFFSAGAGRDLRHPVLLKLDVESFEPSVLRGGTKFVERHRPFVVAEILPDGDVEFFRQFMHAHGYRHYWLVGEDGIVDAGQIQPSLQYRDHLFVPEDADREFATMPMIQPLLRR